MIPTSRRLEYAMGFLALGLLDQASHELDAVPLDDASAALVMAIRLQVHVTAERWDAAAVVARRILETDSSDLAAWIALGCALRRIDGITAAKDILCEAEAVLQKPHAIVHYNLSCYYCLLGETDLARVRLAQACRLDQSFKTTALNDPDLEAIRADIATL